MNRSGPRPHFTYSHSSKDIDMKPLLVDITEHLLAGPHTHELSQAATNRWNSHELSQSDRNTSHIILWYNRPHWLSLTRINACLPTCFYKNCVFSGDAKLAGKSSAIIFSMTNKGIGKNPPLLPAERPAEQAWIFLSYESPTVLQKLYSKFLPKWKNSFNWSMSYRLDSDIVSPYGYLRHKINITERNYTKLFRTKTKFAAWIVSNCNALSQRDKFVKKLKDYGIAVDIYGRCGTKLTDDPREMIKTQYKFYLSFENSFCSDYVTEKFFKYFSSDTVLIVRGGADYRKLIPDSLYINTADFHSFSELVEYLKFVGSNETVYTAYLKRMDRYEAVSRDETRCLSFCALCRKLNYLTTHRKTYRIVPKYLDTCHNPEDISNWT